MTADPYTQLLERCREVYVLQTTASALHWDLETYLPPKAVAFRAEQLSYLEGKAHRLFTDPSVGDWIRACEDIQPSPETGRAANVREWRRSYDRAVKIPAALVEEAQRVFTLSREAWKEARAEADFTKFAPHLVKIVDLTRQKADLWGYQESPYDALLEEYEPGTTAGSLRPLFGELQAALVPLVERLARDPVPADYLKGHYPEASQAALNARIAQTVGYDFEGGRIDTTTHPFATSLGPEDHRITTRYDEQLFQVSLYGVLHETGHALYEQGLDKTAAGTPLGAARSLGIHESQSRLWENHVGRTGTFWARWYQTAAEHLPDLRRFTPDEVARGVKRVAPSFIRVEADEVTYDLHILLRFDIELALVEQRLAIGDLPAAWNERFEQLFGLKVPNDRLGVLQDIHWSLGALGYFPTYSLGNLNAAQLMAAAERSIPDLPQQLAVGEYARLLDWLRKNVHQHGQRFETRQLMAEATGESTQARHRIEYLRKKYT
ncbi:MAG: carboxypeptidase M32 [Verrucomicrobia bacterium]|nr:carboxypeptidase M32 [Verrucomicrobiota bacterium]